MLLMKSMRDGINRRAARRAVPATNIFVGNPYLAHNITELRTDPG
jgi:hypothetical protein